MDERSARIDPAAKMLAFGMMFAHRRNAENGMDATHARALFEKATLCGCYSFVRFPAAR